MTRQVLIVLQNRGSAAWRSAVAVRTFRRMLAARRPAASRLILATLALLAAFAQPATAVLHGVTHRRMVTDAAGLALATGADEFASATPASALGDAPDDHAVLHTRTAATRAWSASPALPAVVVRSLVLATVVRTAVVSRAPPAYPLASHALLSDQPRAPPLG